MNIEQIDPNVYVTTVYPGINLGLILTDEGPIAVDAPLLPDDIAAWKDKVQDLAGKPLRYTILTDHRPERVLGATSLGAPVVGGRGLVDILYDEDTKYAEDVVERWAEAYPEAEHWLKERALPKPEIGIAGRVTLHGSPPVVVESIFGPGPGSIWIQLVDAGILFVGDVVVNTHPFLADAPSTREWLRTLVHIRRPYFHFDVIVPGRGPVADKEATRPVSEYIQLARRRMRSFQLKDRPVDDLDEVVPELMEMFPVDEGQEEVVRSRVRDGLARVLAEMQPEEPEEED